MRLLMMSVLKILFLVLFLPKALAAPAEVDYAEAKRLYDHGYSYEVAAKALSDKATLEKELLDDIQRQLETNQYSQGETRYSLIEKYKKQTELHQSYVRDAQEKYLLMQKKYQEALAEFIRLESQNPNRDDLMFFIASMYDQGRGVGPLQVNKPFAPDPLSAYHWFSKAAHLGNFVAQYNLAGYYYDGRPGFPENLKEAYYWYSVAAGDQALPGHSAQKQAYAPAQYMLGKMILQGRVGKKNTALGLQYLSEAAKNLYAPAAFELAMLLMYGGMDVTPDRQRSIHYLITAAESGYPEALAQIGKMLQVGDPFQKNPAAALVLYNLAYYYEKDPAQKMKYQKSLNYMLETVSEQQYQASHKIAEDLTAQGMFYYVLSKILQLHTVK